mgnify:CR=1 FL=1
MLYPLWSNKYLFDQSSGLLFTGWSQSDSCQFTPTCVVNLVRNIHFTDGSKVEDEILVKVNEFNQFIKDKHFCQFYYYDWVRILLEIEQMGKSGLRKHILGKISELILIRKAFSREEFGNLFVEPEKHIKITQIGMDNFLLYNQKTHLFIEINSSSMDIFNLSVHYSCVAEIVKQFAQLYDQNYDNIFKDVIGTLKVFCIRGFLKVWPSQTGNQ